MSKLYDVVAICPKCKREIASFGGGKYCNKKCFRLSKIGKNQTDEHIKKRVNLIWKGGNKLSRKRYSDKHKNDLKYQLNRKMASGVYKSLIKGIKNGRTWQSLVSYNVKQLEKRLKFTMPKDYIWQDFLDGKLHIDHIIPISFYNFDKPEDLQFKKCWALNNLRLLPKMENIKKSNKLIKSVQIGLKV